MKFETIGVIVTIVALGAITTSSIMIPMAQAQTVTDNRNNNGCNGSTFSPINCQLSGNSGSFNGFSGQIGGLANGAGDAGGSTR